MTETTMNEKAQMGRQNNRTHLQRVRLPAGSLFDNPDKAALEQTFSEIHELNLESNLAELEVQGYTAIKEAIPPEQLKRAKEAIIRIKEDITGKKVDIDNETDSLWSDTNVVFYLLFEDPVFESIVQAPKPLALISYLLGRSCKLSSLTCHFKGMGDNPLPLHCDNGNGQPPPFSMISEVANVNYALTPYSEEAGALAMVPGSHRLCRRPHGDEIQLGGDHGNPNAVPVNMAPGDCTVWHGNTWHGSYRRQVPGIRMNLAVYFCRQHIQTQEKWGEVVPDEILERQANNTRFLQLLGQTQVYPYAAAGPDPEKWKMIPKGQFD
jgi:ectoine hydroxylase-related dioxygenase (phytanoyl-CoA dioxygenase family)